MKLPENISNTIKQEKLKIAASIVVVAGVAVAYPTVLTDAENEFSEQDIEFMQRMSVHHDQAIVMSDWAPERTNKSRILELADNISSVQGQEHRQMEEWTRKAGYEVHPEIEGQMAGMASEQEMERLENSTGPKFNRLYLELMIEHHVGGVEMAQKEVGNGQSQKLVEMAREMVEIQEKEIETMKNWQRDLTN